MRLWILAILVLLAACYIEPQEEVVGRRYLGDSARECAGLRFTCESGEQQFFDDTGCGCEPLITTFSECVAAGNPVMESYPRQCKAGSETFVEEI